MIVPVVSEREWMRPLGRLPIWEPTRKHAIVIAPHPDDETLGAGGLISLLRSRGTEVTIVAVTDGEKAYPGRRDLAQTRQREQTEALARLGVDSSRIQRLRLPDSAVAEHESQLLDLLMSLVPAEAQIIAPWRRDFHPDHEACGRVAEVVSKRQAALLFSYFFWTWHLGTPQILAGLPLVSLPLGAVEREAKREALLSHQSQLQHESGDPILPRTLLQPAWRTFEVFLPA